MTDDGVLFAGDSELDHYEVVDTIYAGRPARVLYSGRHQAAMSGVAHDDQRDLLFDYNQRFLELIDGLRPQSLLLIGGGANTLPSALQSDYPEMVIDIVELDPLLTELAQKYFDFRPSPRVQVHHTDGRSYLETGRKSYDLIIVDAFTNTTVPPDLQTVQAAAALQRRLQPNGAVAMNIIASYHGLRSTVLRRQIAAFQTAFNKVSIFPASRSLSLWLPQNFVLVSQNTERDIAQYIRFAPLLPLRVDNSDAVND